MSGEEAIINLAYNLIIPKMLIYDVWEKSCCKKFAAKALKGSTVKSQMQFSKTSSLQFENIGNWELHIQGEGGGAGGSRTLFQALLSH